MIDTDAIKNKLQARKAAFSIRSRLSSYPGYSQSDLPPGLDTTFS